VESSVEWLSHCRVNSLLRAIPPSVHVVGLGQGGVNVPLHAALSPFKSIDVIALRKIDANSVVSSSSVDVVGPWSTMVESSRSNPWVISSRLHDVNLSRGSPSSVCIVSRQHPNSRPQLSARGKLGSDFESSIKERSRCSSVDSTRSVWLGPRASLSIGTSTLRPSVSLSIGFQNQGTIVNEDILVSGCVALQFVVSATVAGLFFCPIGRQSIELVGPCKSTKSICLSKGNIDTQEQS